MRQDAKIELDKLNDIGVAGIGALLDKTPVEIHKTEQPDLDQRENPALSIPTLFSSTDTLVCASFDIDF